MPVTLNEQIDETSQSAAALIDLELEALVSARVQDETQVAAETDDMVACINYTYEHMY